MTTQNEPKVIVTDVQKIETRGYGNAGKIALIGAFPTSTVQINSYTGLKEAQNDLIGEYTPSTIPEGCVSYGCLPYIFNSNKQSKGPEEVIIVNTNYGATELSYTIDNTKLAAALLVLADEDFDILTIADTVSLGTSTTLNAMFNTLHSFVLTMYEGQKPFGIITAIDIDNTDTNGDTKLAALKTLFEDKGIYKLITTPVHIRGDVDALSLAQSGCWHSAFTAGRPANKSETGKLYEELQGEDSKSLFPISSTTGVIDWENLVDAGLHTTKYRNRRLQTVQCINNMTPHGWDMKIERVKNYMVKALQFADVFGEDNTTPTISYVQGLFEYEKKLAIDNNYISDMDYEITQCGASCVKANLALYIPDVVRTVRLDVAVEITPYVEE